MERVFYNGIELPEPPRINWWNEKKPDKAYPYAVIMPTEETERKSP